MNPQLPFDVPGTRVKKSDKTNFRAFAVKFPRPGRATVGATWSFYVFAANFTAIALGAGTGFFFARRGLRWSNFPFFPFAICGILAAAGVAIFLSPWFMRQVVIDRQMGLLLRPGRKRDPLIGRGLPLRDIAAVQVCSGMTTGDSDSAPFWMYEVNLVLSRPAGERVYVLSHADEKALRADAQKLAVFLGVPILEGGHAVPDAATQAAAAAVAALPAEIRAAPAGPPPKIGAVRAFEATVAKELPYPAQRGHDIGGGLDAVGDERVGVAEEPGQDLDRGQRRVDRHADQRDGRE